MANEDATHHETQIPPLVEKISIDIDAVGFGKIARYELSNGGKIDGLFAALVLYIPKLRRSRQYLIAHSGLFSEVNELLRKPQRTIEAGTPEAPSTRRNIKPETDDYDRFACEPVEARSACIACFLSSLWFSVQECLR